MSVERNCTTSASTRRIATLAGHFRATDETPLLLQSFPTLAMAPSVFEHVQQAPEDPILGVRVAIHSVFSLFAFLTCGDLPCMLLFFQVYYATMIVTLFKSFQHEDLCRSEVFN